MTAGGGAVGGGAVGRRGLARVVDGDADVRHADLLSLLLFTPSSPGS